MIRKVKVISEGLVRRIIREHKPRGYFSLLSIVYLLYDLLQSAVGSLLSRLGLPLLTQYSLSPLPALLFL